MAKKQGSSYEEERQRNVEENKKKIEALNLHHLSSAIQKPQIPRTPPQIKQRRTRIDVVSITPPRRSRRLANLPEPKNHKEHDYIDSSEILKTPRRIIRVNSDILYLMNQTPVSHEQREKALKKAEDLQSKLDPSFPSFVRSMLYSHVTRVFWFGFYKQWCVDYLPKSDCTITLMNEKGDEFDTIYFSARTALSGGWRGFAMAHKLIDGDACVFHLIKSTTFKVYIVRAHECDDDDDN